MQQNLPCGEYAAQMYSAISLILQLKLYDSPVEKESFERDLQNYEELFLQAQDPSILAELGIPPATGGYPPPPGC